ncbi:MAG: DUF1579 family protein [Planctomycetota bacterium]|nr:DUF1579 family protein [Planctomycetota bacterium]
MSKLPPFVASLALTLGSAACVSNPDPPRSRPPAVVASVSLAEQAALQESATRPGKQHRALDPLVGAWLTSNVAVDAQGRESDPMPGRAAIDWALGGRYLRIDASLDIPGGASHTWSGFLGFDQARDEYQWLMVSDLSTGMGVAHGRGELSHAGIRFVLDVVDPRSGAMARATSHLRALDPDHVVLDQIGTDPTGLERVLRRTHYTRAPKAG